MTTPIARSLELLDAVQRSLPEHARLQPMATDEGLLGQVEQLLHDEGMQVPRDHIEAVARQLDQQKSKVSLPHPVVEDIPRVEPTSTVASCAASPSLSRWIQWKVKTYLALGRWLTLRARDLLPDQDLMRWGSVEDGVLTPEEQKALIALRANAQRHSPHIPNDELHRWRLAIWDIIRERRRAHDRGHPYPSLTADQHAKLGVVPQGQDPLISAHFRSSAFEDIDRNTLADLLYPWFDGPDQLTPSAVDWPLLDALVKAGLSPDVDQGRVWLGMSHPSQEGWTVRQSCAYWLLADALVHLGKALLPVPKEENQSLLWWATQAHYDIPLPRYWGYWTIAPSAWGKRFQDTVLWILRHEPAGPFHAKLLRKALAQNHPESEWIRREMKRRGWVTF